MSQTSDVNRAFFNEEAAVYDNKHEKTLNQLADAIRSKLGFIGVPWVEDGAPGGGEPETRVRLLDYACGTGLISRTLGPYTTQCVGVDVSEKMVEAYNRQAHREGLPSTRRHAVVGDLTSPAPSTPFGSALETDPAYTAFDVAVVSLALHHMDEPSLVVRRLAERLRPGGVLVVVDFLRHEATAVSHAARKSVAHDGFAIEDVERMFEDAGCAGGFAATEMKGVEFPSLGGDHGHGGHQHGSHAHGHPSGGDSHHRGAGHHADAATRERRAFIARGVKL